MPKRIKKPPVKPEKRQEWLSRVEREGETLTHIAETDEFDLRTVRKHVELARMERDVKQARSEVLRNALQGHHEDLLKTAGEIENQVFSGQQVSLDADIPLMSALRQHMPRSPLWENLRRWNRTLQETAAVEAQVRDKLQVEIEADDRLSNIHSTGATGAVSAATAVLALQLEQWARGQEGLKLERDFKTKPTSGDKGIVNYGFSFFGEIDLKDAELIEKVLNDFEGKLRNWPEYYELQKLHARIGRLRKSIHETTTVILLRRIVPGRCKFCPI